MPTPAELRDRYANLGDAELLDLATRPQELTLEAQTAVAAEVERRGLSTSSNSPAAESAVDQTSHVRRPWHRGWITVFEIWVSLSVIAFAAGYILSSPVFNASLLWLPVFLAVPMIGLVLIARRSPKAPRFWTVVLGLSLVLTIAAPPLLGGYSGGSIARALQVFAWFVYWQKSRRVIREFPSNKLTEVAA